MPLAERTVQVRTPAGLALAVRSVLPPGDETPEPKPATPPRPLPIGDPFWWTLAVRGRARGAGPCALAWRRRESRRGGGGAGARAAAGAARASSTGWRPSGRRPAAHAAPPRPARYLGRAARLPGARRARRARSIASSSPGACRRRWSGRSSSCCAPAIWSSSRARRSARGAGSAGAARGARRELGARAASPGPRARPSPPLFRGGPPSGRRRDAAALPASRRSRSGCSLLLALPLLAWLHHRRPALGALTYSRLPGAAPAAPGGSTCRSTPASWPSPAWSWRWPGRSSATPGRRA